MTLNKAAGYTLSEILLNLKSVKSSVKSEGKQKKYAP